MSSERNISLYLVYRGAADAFAWLPIFFLFFSERLTLSEVLLLESIYYVAVVITEVPSGYLSDVLGRRLTLLISAVTIIASYLFFLSSNQFFGLAIGQCLLAAGSACRSGTDTALHYESLAGAGREAEYGDREALAGRIGFLSTATAALAGGLLGRVDLVWPYWFSLLAAIVMLGITWRFVEPSGGISQTSAGFVRQLGKVAGYWRDRTLLWLFGYFVVMYAIVHVPYEFYQPYLSILDVQNRLGSLGAPLSSGIIFALTALVGSWVAGRSMVWCRKIGLFALLNLAAIVELFVIGALAFVLHPALAALVLLRNGPMAVITAPIRATIAPRVADEHRATYLSMQSLVARLGFAVLLVVLSLVIGEGKAPDWETLSTVLRVALGVGTLSVLALWLAGRRLSLDAN